MQINGVSFLGIQRGREKVADRIEELRNNDKEEQKQVRYNEISKSKFNQKYKYTIKTDNAWLPEYLKKVGRGASQRLLAQARCGSLESWSKYWVEEESRRFEFCGHRSRNLEHMTRECGELERGASLEEVIDERDRKSSELVKKSRKEKEGKK